ncbi:MAG: hypothetical protein V2A73_20925 [Pseudomonadota bacterium]
MCIDQYEASEGTSGEAVSAAEVMPWTNVTWYEAKDACELSGKRLCDGSEFNSSLRCASSSSLAPTGKYADKGFRCCYSQ